MSFREKIHWLAFVGLIAAFGWYFFSYPWEIVDTPKGMYAAVWMLLPVSIIFLVPMIAGAAFFAIRSPKEADMKEDEREKGIHLRGTYLAYYPLAIGVQLNVFVLINGYNYGYVVTILVATLVVAELIRVGSQLYYYRRGY
jgi:hypothetical protein